MRMQLEQTAGKDCIENEKVRQYSIFAEQYLEKPVYGGKDESSSITTTVCTWRGVPTIDDW